MSAAGPHDWFRRATSRRSLLRGGAIGAGAALAGPAILGGSADASAKRAAAVTKTPLLLTGAAGASGSAIAPFGRAIAYGADPAKSTAIAWLAQAPVNNPFIRIGSSPCDLNLHPSVSGSRPGQGGSAGRGAPIDTVLDYLQVVR